MVCSKRPVQGRWITENGIGLGRHRPEDHMAGVSGNYAETWMFMCVAG
jgi:hypothetical protein